MYNFSGCQRYLVESVRKLLREGGTNQLKIRIKSLKHVLYDKCTNAIYNHVKLRLLQLNLKKTIKDYL